MPQLRDTQEAIQSILRLRRAERGAEVDLGDTLVPTREFLEDLVGPTVRPAEVARLLGMSHPALNRWIEKGEISSVMTPAGRREIPLSELLGLMEEVEQSRERGVSRPVTHVMRERNRRAHETVDVDDLLPRRHGRGHRTAELQALAYHRLIAQRLDDQMVNDARHRLNRWRKSGRVHPRWADEWERVLALPRSRIAKSIGADTPAARQLRQSSPFAGSLTEQERTRLVQAVENRA
jgi:excisionase family DNA binding protein